MEDNKINLCEYCTNLTLNCKTTYIDTEEASIDNITAKCDNFHSKQRTEMIQKCYDLMSEIDKKFKPFKEIFLKQYRGNITEEEMLNQMRSIIAEMNNETMEEFNEMYSMFSSCNCGWDSYKTGKIVHDLLIEKWYPNKLN